MKIEKLGIFVLSFCLGACGPQVGGSGDDAGEEEGEAQGDDLGSEEFDVEWAMGFYYLEDGLVGGTLAYMEIEDNGLGVLHRISCDFSPLEPLSFQWRALSDAEIELYPAEGEELVPSLTGLTEGQTLRRKSSDSPEILASTGVVGSDGVTLLSGRPCNVPPPKEGCPMPGFGRTDEIPICDEQ